IWNERYPNLNIEGQIWEQLIVNSIKKSGFDVDWDSRSHEKGTDIRFKMEENEILLSAKTGKISGGIRSACSYSFSSYRTTSFKTLDEKINHIDSTGEKFDFYLCLFKIDPKHYHHFSYKYIIALIPSFLLKAGQLTWTTD